MKKVFFLRFPTGTNLFGEFLSSGKRIKRASISDLREWFKNGSRWKERKLLINMFSMFIDKKYFNDSYWSK
jgi:hypothetical protein